MLPAVCTVVLSFDPKLQWPLLIGANRDEMLDRTWEEPAAHWPTHEGVIGGRDELAGGTWLAVNRQGVVAAVLNRLGTLGPAPGKKSRGDLPLMALLHETAEAAAAELEGGPAGDWRSFNLIVADRASAWFIRGTGQGRMQSSPIKPGVHMVTARELDDFSSPRIARNLMRFRKATRPVPPEWSDWPRLLGDRTLPMDAAINIPPFSGFGTASSALIGIGAEGERCFLFAPGPPDEVEFEAVPLD